MRNKRPAELSVRDIIASLRPGELWTLLGALAALLGGAFVVGAFFNTWTSAPKTSVNVNLDEAFRTYREVVEENLRLQLELDSLKKRGGGSELKAEKLKLEKRIAELEAEQRQLSLQSQVIYVRFIEVEEPEDQRGNRQLDYVRLSGSGIEIDTYHYIATLRRLRRFGGAASLLHPVFSPGQRVCKGGECRDVLEAYPGYIPVYKISAGGVKSAYWSESALDPNQKWIGSTSGFFSADSRGRFIPYLVGRKQD